MASLGTTQLTSLLLVMVVAAALCGFVAATVAQRKKRRTRRVFLAGVFCGLLAGELVRGRRRAMTAFTGITRALGLAALPVRPVLARQRPRRLHKPVAWSLLRE